MDVFHCGHPKYGETTATKCKKCPDFESKDKWPIRFDERNLFPGTPGLRFNSAITREPRSDGYLICFRTGWEGCNLYMGRLDRNFQPRGSAWKLEIDHRHSNYGREDPRFFWHNERLHVSFIGVVGKGIQTLNTNQLYTRLTPDYRVDQVFYPDVPGRNSWEKNHGYFSHDGNIYAIYSIAPHRILRIDGERVTWAYDTPTNVSWSGGETRPGSAPVLFGDEYWCFFHDRVERDGQRIYRMGVYTFENKPPFRIKRWCREPILTADPSTKPRDQYASVVFPCGAVLSGNSWVISCGVHDHRTELYRFLLVDLEERLEVINPPFQFITRAGTDDQLILDSVDKHNEYRLPERFALEDMVIDIGAHIGSFAYAAWKRGSRNIHSYEASASNFVTLSQNAYQLEGVTPYLAAVWSESGIDLECGIDDIAVGNPSASAWYKIGTGLVRGNLVVSISLDDIIGSLGGRRVAFLKLDCEGAEFPILLASKFLGRVDRIAMEVHGDRGDAIALRERLVNFGFSLGVIPSANHPHLMLLFARR